MISFFFFISSGYFFLRKMSRHEIAKKILSSTLLKSQTMAYVIRKIQFNRIKFPSNTDFHTILQDRFKT